MIRRLLFGILCISFLLPSFAYAAEYDLGLSVSDIFFDQENLIKGKPFRIYATIKNYGEKDVTAYVSFYSGPVLIGSSQNISVRARGLADEVFVDWVVPDSSFNILAKIQAQDPKDENVENDVALTKIFIPDDDTDSDGIPDKQDDDDDNDGIKDIEEAKRGTNPLSWDSDSDGASDYDDEYPLDPNKQRKEEEKPIVIVQEEIKPQIANQTSQNNGTDSTNSSLPKTNIASKITNSLFNSANAKDEQPDSLEEESTPLETITLSEESTSNEIDQVYINADQKTWNTYVFEGSFSGMSSKEDIKYIWHLPENVIKQGRSISHTFGFPGTYTVLLEIQDKEIFVTEEMTIQISFFNLNNPWLWLLIAILLAISLLMLILVLRKKLKEDQK